MGWFWADSGPEALFPRTSTQTAAPAVCPMSAKPSARTGGLFNGNSAQAEGGCPYEPIETQRRAASSETNGSKLNPLNRMPFSLAQSRADGQTVDLPTNRSVSTIPRGRMDEEGNWVYPSPQQMYNALLRKGYTDTPQDAIEEMVAVHNFLNEGAWAEIVDWERRFARGLSEGWRRCASGEEAAAARDLGGDGANEELICQPRLLRFEGRPKDMTPKASILQLMGFVYPAKFGCEPPFDRHDWYIQRQSPGHESREIRYVIDYYSGPPDPTGEAVFYLDVRPAIDRPSAAVERMMRWGGDVWYRASGGATRDGSSS